MNYEAMVLLIRAILTCLDKEQALALERWVKTRAMSPDPASDSFMNAEMRRMDVAIEQAISEIHDYAGRNA